MQQKFIVVEGIRIAYIEQNPDSDKVIFFIHGNSCASGSWINQLESGLLNNYKLIAFDLPAHGDSDALNGSGYDYSLLSLGKIMWAALRELADEKKYILAGLSIGTNIIAEMLACNAVPAGIITVGSCMLGGEYTMEKVFKPGIDLHAGFTDEVLEEELMAYRQLAFESNEETAWQEFADTFYKVKDNFRSKMFATVAEGKLSNEVGILQQKAIQSLVIFGEDEKVCNQDYLDNAGLKLWTNTTYKIKNAGHFVNIDQPGKLNKLISDFAKDIFK